MRVDACSLRGLGVCTTSDRNFLNRTGTKVTLLEMLSCSKYLLVLVVLLGFMSRDSSAAILRPYQSQLEDKARQEVIRLAARIIKVTMYGSRMDMNKRNGGTLDSLLNFPDLSDNGKR